MPRKFFPPPHLRPTMLIIGLLLPLVLPAQQDISWAELAGVRFSRPAGERDPLFGLPTFDSTAQALAGQRVRITGYMLPLTVENKRYILSRYPYTSCFFCGGAGKETIIELHLDRPQAFDIDTRTTVTGTLSLVSDPLAPAYRLEAAVPE